MTPKDVFTNKSFCPIPWAGIMVNHEGRVKNCIRSVHSMPIGDLKNDRIEDIVLGAENVKRQEQILNKLPVSSCQTCYDIENNKKGLDIISDRIFYIRELKHNRVDFYQKGNFNLQTIDIRWSNVCNFACVYCSSDFSSKWADELKIKQETISSEQKNNFKNYILENAQKLKHVYLAGGEPLLMKENLELLEVLDKNVNLRINTNLSKTDTRIFEKICEFKNVHWTVSIETMEDEFEYIRYGSTWQDFLENLDVVKKLKHKISFNMLYFALNYQSIFRCIDFLKSLGNHNNSFIAGALLTPFNLNIRHLPDSVLNSCKNILQERINNKPGFLLEDSYRNMLSYINQPIEKNLSSVKKALQELDQRRNLNSENIFKDLYNLF